MKWRIAGKLENGDLVHYSDGLISIGEEDEIYIYIQDDELDHRFIRLTRLIRPGEGQKWQQACRLVWKDIEERGSGASRMDTSLRQGNS